MNDAFEVHCNGFTRRVSYIIPFLPLSVAELEDAATVQLLSKRKSAFKAWGMLVGWTEAALELISSGSFEDTKARLKVLDAKLGASMSSKLGGKGIGRHVTLLYENMKGELALKFSHPSDEEEFAKVVENALSPSRGKPEKVWAIKEESEDGGGAENSEKEKDSGDGAAPQTRVHSDSVSDAPKLRTRRKRRNNKVSISTRGKDASRKRAETGSLRLSTLTRQATLSPSRPRLATPSMSSTALNAGESSKLRSLVGLTPKEMAVHVVEQREKREVAKVESTIRNAVKLVQRRMSVRLSTEDIKVEKTKKQVETKKETEAVGVLSSVSWRVKAGLALAAVIGLSTVLAPIVFPIAITALEMTFMTAIAPYAGILLALGAVCLALLYQFPALRKFAWRAVKWCILNWRKLLTGLGFLLLIWIAFVLMRIFKNVQDAVSSLDLLSSRDSADVSPPTTSSKAAQAAHWDTDGDGALSAPELVRHLKTAFRLEDDAIRALIAEAQRALRINAI